MKMYDYHCEKCENEFEALAKEKEVVECPQCGNPAIKIFKKSSITVASFRDGCNRWSSLKERSKLEDKLVDANYSNDKETVKKLKEEIKKLD